MRRFLLFYVMCISVVTLYAQGQMVCNFDDVSPVFMDKDANLNCSIVAAPEGSLASGNMLSVTNINGNSTGSNWLAIELNLKFDPRNYVGISFLAQVPGGVGVKPDFSLKLEQTTNQSGGDFDPGRIQSWQIYKKYTGEGEWQEVHISFEKLLSKTPGDKYDLAYKLEQNPDFPADQFDRIVLVLFSYYSGAPGSLYAMNIDNIQLRTSWTDEPEPTGKNLLVCDFDDVMPYVDNSGDILYDVDNADVDSPASGQIGVFDIPENNEGDYIALYLDKTFDPREYVGLSFLAQIPEGVSPDFAIKLEQSKAAMNRIQTFANYDKYTGNGEWQEVHIKFDKLLSKEPGDNDDLAYRLAQNPEFPADKYDVIVIVPGAYNNLSAFTLKMDDITLRANWDDKPKPKNTLLSNFDTVLPFNMTYGGISGAYDAEPVGSENFLTLLSPGGDGSKSDNWFTIWTDFKFDPRDYVGISFRAKVPEEFKVRFGFRLQQSSDPGNNNALQNLTYYEEYNAGEYTGAGEWQEVHLLFDHMTLKAFNKANRPKATNNVTNIWDKLSENSNYPVDQFDKISVALHSFMSIAAHTLLVDDIWLRSDWEDLSGFHFPKKDMGAINLFAENGMVRAIAAEGQPVALKVYALSGQEIANGVNQVQVGIKGIYIVKATTGNTNTIHKIVVQ